MVARHQQTCGTVSARVGHSKRIHLSELSFRTIEGACSRLLPSHALLVQSGVKDRYRKLFNRQSGRPTFQPGAKLKGR
jgi:hypothetical protein